MKWAKQRRFGDIRLFSSSNCQTVQAPNIRLSRALGGGPVLDVGIYSINAARYVIGEEPVEITAFANQPEDDPRFEEVPESVVFLLRYPSGALAVCDCSFGTLESRRYRIQCTGGHIEMDPAFGYRGLKLRTEEKTSSGIEKSDVSIEEVNQFAAEMDAFSKCVIHDMEPRTPGESGIADLRIIEAIQEAIKTRSSVHLEV
jgi:predicted dehydrogenase